MLNVKNSADFFDYLKENKFETVVAYLKAMDANELSQALNSDEEKIVFWTNVYNSFFQYLAKTNSASFNKSWTKFFDLKQLNIAGTNYSLNHIEHRFLRKSQFLYGFGYIESIFKVKNELLFRVDKADYRVHFVLNCGANSCPQIIPLSIENLENELQAAEEQFILSESSYNAETNSLKTSRIFLFYFGDFKGRNGIIELHRKHKINPLRKYTRIQYIPFDKNVKLDNYR